MRNWNDLTDWTPFLLQRVISLPMSNWNVYVPEGQIGKPTSVISLPMRNWNDDKELNEQILRDELLAYLWGIEIRIRQLFAHL